MPQDLGDDFQRLLDEGRITCGDSHDIPQKINLISFTNHIANFSASPRLSTSEDSDDDSSPEIGEGTKK